MSKLHQERRQITDHDVYFNSQFSEKPLYVEPGGIECLQKREDMLVATVGNGLLMVVHDPELKIGAMAYTLLPEPVLEAFPFFAKADPKLVKQALKPIDECINALKRAGAGKSRIRVRLLGGMRMLDDSQDHGTKNMVFVQEYLARKGISLLNADLGGPLIRRVHFFPMTGRMVRFMLRRQSDFAEVKKLEAAYNKKITTGS